MNYTAAIIGLIAQLSIGLGDGVRLQVSGALLFMFLTAITGGIWKCASILSDMRNSLKIGERRMDELESAQDAQASQITNIKTDLATMKGKVGL